MLATTSRHCPTCSIEVPARTGKFCPACGGSMDQPAVRAAHSPALSGPPDRDGALAAPEAIPVALPLALGAAGAVLGALVWAGIAALAGVEIGYVAWGVGALVGGGAVLGGARGMPHCVCAAALALAGILGGKLYGAHLLIEQQFANVEAMFDRANFDRLRAMAAHEAAAPGGETFAGESHDEGEAPEEHAGEGDEADGGADEADEADETDGTAATDEVETVVLSPEEQAEFEKVIAAARADRERAMARFCDPAYTFEQWRADQIRELRSHVSVTSFVGENFGLIDVLFVVLGLATACGLVNRAGRTSLV